MKERNVREHSGGGRTHGSEIRILKETDWVESVAQCDDIIEKNAYRGEKLITRDTIVGHSWVTSRRWLCDQLDICKVRRIDLS